MSRRWKVLPASPVFAVQTTSVCDHERAVRAPYDVSRPRGDGGGSNGRPRTAVYRHGHTFTWTSGDDLIAVQRGRVANADRRILVIHDDLPSVPMLLGRQPVLARLRPSPGAQWHDVASLTAAADRWAADRRQHAARKAIA